MLRNNARILRYAFRAAMADWRAMYTWKTWTFGWLSRILCQVAFFSLIGRLVGHPGTVEFLVVGNAVFMVAQSVLLTISSTAWERMGGTYPLLVIAPGSLFTAFAGRSSQWILDGVACSAISLFVMAPVFGVPLRMPAGLLALPVIFVISASVYGFGLVIGAAVLKITELRALAANVSLFFLMLLTGVQVPGSFWPGPVGAFANVLPITHGLRAVRELTGGASLVSAGTQAGLEFVVGAGWLLVAGLVFIWSAERGRVDGSIEMGG